MSEKIHRTSYEVKSGRNRYRYWFDEKYVYRTWSRGPDFAKDFFPLDDLSDEYSQSAGRPSAAAASARNAIGFIVAAIVVFFSDYNAKIPLLAPVLLLIGIVRLAWNWDSVVPKKWTVVRYLGGDDALYILHGDELDQERAEFEKALAGAIRRSASNG